MSGWLKRLRKKLRNRRPALLLASIMIVVLVTAGLAWYVVGNTKPVEQNDEAQLVLAPQNVQVVLVKKYLVGPNTEETLEFTVEELDQFVTSTYNLTKVEENENVTVFEQQISDISPVLKENGYFALDQNGVLNLYQGEAKEENIIQTFFQIDLDRLETTLPVEEYMKLREGIPFSTLAEYNSILSTYSEFAIFGQEQEAEER